MQGQYFAVSLGVVVLAFSSWSNCVYHGANQFIA